jgi:hypothetical protein
MVGIWSSLFLILVWICIRSHPISFFSWPSFPRLVFADKGFRKSEQDRAASERIFRAAREAYEILLDPQRRREFDSGTGEFAAPNL